MRDAQTQESSLRQRAGNRLAEVLRSHFQRKDATEPNRLGGPRTHFWDQVAESVDDSEAAQGWVRIRHPHFRQKLFGGVIRARNAKALTIPVAPEAHGRSASQLKAETGLHLFVLRSTQGRGRWLAARLGDQVRTFYALRTQVNQDPTPDALPPRETLIQAIHEALTEPNESPANF